MTICVGIVEAKTRFSDLVHRVEGGEDVLITKRGKPVARLVAIDRESAAKVAVAHLLMAREAARPGPGSLRELISERRP